ncbi:MAG TPA: DJ-1/PfpI family protein [Thermoanaerobaculia bacterium]|nr:DJ-1/PfpI family protein [Thermoanaerobaculia bacterium]
MKRAWIPLVLSILIGVAFFSVRSTSQQGGGGERNVAILVYEGVEPLDFAGPGEVFASTRGFRTFSIAANDQPVESGNFFRIVPEHTFASHPRIDILVVPGGDAGNVLYSRETMAWVRKTGREADLVLSVCNGATIIASAGLLDGLEATTHQGTISSLREMAPRTVVHSDLRFVDNGKVITSAGVSAGIDASLYLVSRLLGEERARRTARYMEYDWRPEKLKFKVVKPGGGS